jgi:predicted nucleotidyltransferase
MTEDILKTKLSTKQKNTLRKQGVVLMYLYGSQAEGRERNDSDVDIAVLINQKTQKDQDKVRYKISRTLAPIFRPIPKIRELDIKLMDELTPSVRHQIALNGRLLFQKSDDDRIGFIKQSLRQYEDTKILCEIRDYYLEQRIKKGIFGYPTPIPLKLYE